MSQPVKLLLICLEIWNHIFLAVEVGEIWKLIGFYFNYRNLNITDWVGTVCFLVKFIKNMQVWKAVVLTECCELKSSEWRSRSWVSNTTTELASTEQVLSFIIMFTFPLHWELHFSNQALQVALSRHWSSCKQMEEWILILSKPTHILTQTFQLAGQNSSLYK